MKAQEWKLQGSDIESRDEQIARVKADREKWRTWGNLSANGIVYSEQLAGPDGMSYLLMPDAEHSMADIEAAAMQIRRDHDVVSIAFVRV